MPLVLSKRRKVHRSSCVPEQSFTDRHRIGFIVIDRPEKPVATIYNESPLLTCLFKRKKAQGES